MNYTVRYKNESVVGRSMSYSLTYGDYRVLHFNNKLVFWELMLLIY